MKWITCERPKCDRTACLRRIIRFIALAAECVYARVVDVRKKSCQAETANWSPKMA